MTSDDPRPSGPSPTGADGAESSESAGGDVLEDVIVVASGLLIVGTLGYLASQAIVAPATPAPTASVDSVEPIRSGGHGGEHVRVVVSLDNRGEKGLQSVAVVVQCGGVERSLEFTHVPARGHRTGTAVCRRGTTPTTSVATWVEA